MNYLDTGSSYDAVAEEYYDVSRHLTCYNFGCLSYQFLYPRIQSVAHRTQSALEIGAGKSIVSAIFEENHFPLSRVTILDKSPGMLNHSSKWISAGAIAKIADAKQTQLPERSFDLIVSSLGDPYDSEEFWVEMHRVIRCGGTILFTTPSFEWSSKFRHGLFSDTAEFSLRNGNTVLVPSFTRPLLQEKALIRGVGFELMEEIMPGRNKIEGPISHKLDVLQASEPVIYCFALKAI